MFLLAPRPIAITLILSKYSGLKEAKTHQLPRRQLDGFGKRLNPSHALLYSARRVSVIPARRGEPLAGDPGGGVGGQKHGDAGDIVGLAEPAQRGARHHVLFEIAADDTGSVGALGLQPARRHGLAADCARANLGGWRARSRAAPSRLDA